MRGKVRTREKCPVCGKPFKVVEEIDIFCPICQTRPRTFYILWYEPRTIIGKGGKGRQVKNHRITRDLSDNQILDSFKRAHRMVERMRGDVDAKTFDLSHYIQPEIEKFKGRRLLVKWYKSKGKADMAPTHRTEIRRYIRTYYAPIGDKILASHDCREIKNYHIEDFFDRLPAALSNKTKKNIMGMLKNFCRWLNWRGILTVVPKFPPISVPKPKKQWILPDTQARIISKMHPHDQAVFGFWMSHPLRNGELRVLRKKHFDLEKWVVRVEDAISEGIIRHRKNREPYVLPLDPEFDASALEDKLPEAFVFLNRKGLPYTQGRLEKIWSAACKKAGAKIRLYHGTRRSKATQLRVLKGADLESIRLILGQKQLGSAQEYADSDTLFLAELLHGAQEVHKGQGRIYNLIKREEKMERVAGLEPVTPTLARSCSTS